MNDSKRNANVYTVLRKKNRARMEEKVLKQITARRQLLERALCGTLRAEWLPSGSARPLRRPGSRRRAPAGRPRLSGGFLKPRLRPGVPPPPAETHGVREAASQWPSHASTRRRLARACGRARLHRCICSRRLCAAYTLMEITSLQPSKAPRCARVSH